MTLTLPDEPVLAAFREDFLRLELAVALYASRSISRELAGRLAGMPLEAFEDELHRRGVSNGYQAGDLNADVAALNRMLGQ